MDSSTHDQPLDPRCREAHPEHIGVGGIDYERNDVAARKYSESERSANRRDKKGAPYVFFGGVKYRPQPHYDNFIASTIQQHKPQPPKRRQRAYGRLDEQTHT
jgi:hypothetical protein